MSEICVLHPAYIGCRHRESSPMGVVLVTTHPGDDDRCGVGGNSGEGGDGLSTKNWVTRSPATQEKIIRRRVTRCCRLKLVLHEQSGESHHGVSTSDGNGGDGCGSEVKEMISIKIEEKCLWRMVGAGQLLQSFAGDYLRPPQYPPSNTPGLLSRRLSGENQCVPCYYAEEGG